MKTCSKCKCEKQLTDFCKDNSVKSGLRSYCKSCNYLMQRNWIEKNKHKVKEYNERSRPKVSAKKKEIQLRKQIENKCIKCNCSLIGRQLLSKYCFDCKVEIKKVWRNENHKRNIHTAKNYFQKNKTEINNKTRLLEANRRENVTDRYVSKLLREKNGFTIEQLKNNPSLLEIKRLIIKTKRICKTS
jgi:hypothetical protein